MFIDEREDGINDAEMVVGMTGIPASQRSGRSLITRPVIWQSGRSLVRRWHSEIKQWKDPRTTPVLRKGQLIPLNVASPNNRTFWMMGVPRDG